MSFQIIQWQEGMEIPAPCCIVGMPNSVYHGMAGVSSSRLKLINTWSPAHYRDPEPFEQTPEMVIGNVLHTMILEPSELQKRYSFIRDWVDAKKPTHNKKPENYTDEENAYVNAKGALEKAGIECINKSLVDLTPYSKAVRSHPKWARLCGREALFEASFFAHDPITGTLVKARPDLLNMTTWRDGERFLVVDLKSAADQRANPFYRQAIKLGYDFSAAMYCEIIKLVTGMPCDWAWVVTPKKGLAKPTIYTMGHSMRERGLALYRKALSTLVECEASGQWPALNNDESVDLEVSRWDELDQGEYPIYNDESDDE